MRIQPDESEQRDERYSQNSEKCTNLDFFFENIFLQGDPIYSVVHAIDRFRYALSFAYSNVKNRLR